MTTTVNPSIESTTQPSMTTQAVAKAQPVEPVAKPAKATGTAGDTNKTATAWRNIVEHPLQSFLTALIIAMLGYSFTTFNINIGRLDNRIDRLEDKVDDKFKTLDNKIDALDDKIDAINLTLTALIAHLGATPQVDAATDNNLPATNTTTPHKIPPEDEPHSQRVTENLLQL